MYIDRQIDRQMTSIPPARRDPLAVAGDEAGACVSGAGGRGVSGAGELVGQVRGRCS